MWNEDEVKGKAEQAKGAIKDKAGELVGSPELEAEGEAERVAGKARETVGKVERHADEAVDKVKKAFDR
jgi:uncharacterized protein YjbJ (UPF0337 family)